MKKLTIMIMVWLCFAATRAQEKIEKHIDYTGKDLLKLKIQIADSINIRTWKKNEVFLFASVNINENKDNKAYKTSFESSGNSVIVSAGLRDDYFKEKNNCCNKSDIYWQIYIPENSDFSIESINANITITGRTAKMHVKSISGYIDLAVPGNRQADIDFSTITGTIYSDQKMTLNKSENVATSALEGKLNDGGPKINLETISGDIFFRKSD